MKELLKTLFLLGLSLGTTLIVNLSAQVTIGSTIPPVKGALLDLKQHDPDANNVTSDKGLFMPRVALTVIDNLSDVVSETITNDIKTTHTGLSVYNVTENTDFCPGIYLWTGDKWEPMAGIFPQTVVSTDASSNAFIIKQGSIFQFPVTKAYNVANDVTWSSILNTASSISTTPSAWDAKLLWQDTKGLVKNVSIIRDATLGQNSVIRVETNPIVCAQGNAVIAVTVSGTIYWTWHLWVTDFDPLLYQKEHNNGTSTTIFMDRNLGALSNSGASAEEAFKAMGLLYQYGRHTPFIGANTISSAANGTSNSKPIYSIDNVQLTEGTPTGGTGVNKLTIPASPIINLANAIQNPLTFYLGGGNTTFLDWYANGTVNANLWNTTANTKTVFDPCPSGWRIPRFNGPAANNSPWFNMAMTSSDQYGFMSATLGFYPATGYRAQATGSFITMGEGGALSAAIGTASNSALMSFTLPATYYPNVVSSRAAGRSVRCVKE